MAESIELQLAMTAPTEPRRINVVSPTASISSRLSYADLMQPPAQSRTSLPSLLSDMSARATPGAKIAGPLLALYQGAPRPPRSASQAATPPPPVITRPSPAAQPSPSRQRGSPVSPVFGAPPFAPQPPSRPAPAGGGGGGGGGGGAGSPDPTPAGLDTEPTLPPLPIGKAVNVAEAYAQDAIQSAATAEQLAGVAGDRALNQAIDSCNVSREAANQAIAQAQQARADADQADAAYEAAFQKRQNYNPPPTATEEQAKAEVGRLDQAENAALADKKKKDNDATAKETQAKKANDAANKAAQAVNKAFDKRHKNKKQELPPGMPPGPPPVLKMSLDPFGLPDGPVVGFPGSPLIPITPEKPQKPKGDSSNCCCICDCLIDCCKGVEDSRLGNEGPYKPSSPTPPQPAPGDKPKPSGGGGGGSPARRGVFRPGGPSTGDGPDPGGAPSRSKPATQPGAPPTSGTADAPSSDAGAPLNPSYGPFAQPGDYEREQLRKDRERAWRRIYEAEGLLYTPPQATDIPGTTEFKPSPLTAKIPWEQLLPDVAHDKRALQGIISEAGIWDKLGFDRTVAHSRNSLKRLEEDVALFEKVRKVFGDARALSWWWRMRQTQWRQLQSTFFAWMFNLCGSVSALSAGHGMGEDWEHTGQRPPTERQQRSLKLPIQPRSGRVRAAGPSGLTARYLGHAADFLIRLFDVMEKKRQEEEASDVDTREPEEVAVEELERAGAFDQNFSEETPTTEDRSEAEGEGSASTQDTPEETALIEVAAELKSDGEPVPQTFSPPPEQIGTIDEVIPGEPTSQASYANAPLVLYNIIPEFGSTPRVPDPRTRRRLDLVTPPTRVVPHEPDPHIPRIGGEAPTASVARPTRSRTGATRPKRFSAPRVQRTSPHDPVNDEPIPVEEHLTPESRKTRGRIGEDTRKIALITDPEISKDPETSKWLRDYLGNQFEKFGRRWTKLRRIEADTSLPTKAREFARSEIKKWEKRWDLHLPKEGDIGPDGKPLTEDYELGHSEHERDPDTGKIIKEGFPAVEGGSHERSRPIPKSQNVAELKTRWAGQKLEKQYLRGLAKQVEDQLRANRLNEARKTVQRFLQYNIRAEKLFQVFPEWREKLGIL